MQEQIVPIRMYRSGDLLTIAAPMAGLGPEDISVEVTSDGRLVLDGRPSAAPKLDCGELTSGKEVLVDEWAIGPYRREIVLGARVDGPRATLTYGNGVLVVALPITRQTRPARLTLEVIGTARGERAGNPAHPAHTRI